MKRCNCQSQPETQTLLQGKKNGGIRNTQDTRHAQRNRVSFNPFLIRAGVITAGYPLFAMIKSTEMTCNDSSGRGYLKAECVLLIPSNKVITKQHIVFTDDSFPKTSLLHKQTMERQRQPRESSLQRMANGTVIDSTDPRVDNRREQIRRSDRVRSDLEWDQYLRRMVNPPDLKF